MSRRRKRSAGGPAGPAPNPPHPNKPFLWAAGLVLAAWIVLLIVLAAGT